MILTFTNLMALTSFAGEPVLIRTALVDGNDLWQEVSGINYDVEWTGKVPKTNQNCRIIIEQDHVLEILIERKYKTIARVKVEISPRMSFTKSETPESVVYKEIRSGNMPYTQTVNVTILKDLENSTATVIYKSSPNDIGMACQVGADF